MELRNPAKSSFWTTIRHLYKYFPHTLLPPQKLATRLNNDTFNVAQRNCETINFRIRFSPQVYTRLFP